MLSFDGGKASHLIALAPLRRSYLELMAPKKKSKRGAHLVSLNKAHPKHDAKHDIDAEPDENFHPEDAPGDESEDDDDDDHLDHGSSNPELEKIRAAGRARKKRSRAAAAATDATPRVATQAPPPE